MAVLKINRNDIEKIDIANIQGGFTASQVMERYKPDILINLALYDMASLTNITKMLDENVESGYLFTDEGIYLDREGDIGWCSFEEAKEDPNKKDYVSGSPILVKGGAVSIEWGNKVSTYLKGTHKRCILGFNNSEVILMSTETETTLEKAAKLAKEAGCNYAINLDGGGSCHLQEGNKVYTKSSRKNVSWLMIYKKKTTNDDEVATMAKVVCLDAGHGKKTGGKRSFDGTFREYEFNRDVTSRLKKILEAHGVKVVLTCKDDADISLSRRAEIANNSDADIFVSIHANAHGTTWNSANGWEIYVCSMKGKAAQLAEKIRKHSIKDLGLKDRGVKTANFAVLINTLMPAVLIEHGFYTNKEECAKLKSDSFRQKCAVADAKGILEYLGITYKGETKAETTTNSKFPYLVKITANNLNVRKGAGTNYAAVCTVKKDEVYTIVAEKKNGSTTWGQLKSLVGWISLSYTKRV